jgi:hypothetical protein
LVRYEVGRYTNKVDIWAIGCVLYEVIFRKRRFANDYSVVEYTSRPFNTDLHALPTEFIYDPGAQALLSNIIKDMLSVDPLDRPTAAQLYGIFSPKTTAPLVEQAHPVLEKIQDRVLEQGRPVLEQIQVPEPSATSPQYPTYHILVLEVGNRLVHYTRKGSDVTRPWTRTAVVSTRATSSAALSSEEPLETLVLEGTVLVHYIYSAMGQWSRGSVVTRTAEGPASLTRRESGYDIILETAVLERQQIVQYSCIGGISWVRGEVICVASDVACLIRGQFEQGNNLELLVLQGYFLVHYWRHGERLKLDWELSKRVTAASRNGPQTMIQNAMPPPGQFGNFEVVVLIGGGRLVHFYRDHAAGGQDWTQGSVISEKADGPGAIIQNDEGDLEVIVPEAGSLIHYWRSPLGTKWERGVTITDNADNAADQEVIL